MSRGRNQKICALARQPGTEGERLAALAALERVNLVAPQRLTEAIVRKLRTPPTGSKIYYDQPDDDGNNCIRGFGVRVTAAGVRAYVLNYRAKSGREGRITIGRPPQWTLTAARAEAKTLKAKIDLGADPAKDEQDRRSADSINMLFDQIVSEHVARKREATRKEYTAIIDTYIRPQLGTMKVAEVEFADVDRLHRKISARAPYRANRALAILSKAFNLAIKWKLRSDNPVKLVERNPERPRERYLESNELKALHRNARFPRKSARGQRGAALAADRIAVERNPDCTVERFRLARRRVGEAECSHETKARPSNTAEPGAVRLLKSMRGAAPNDAVFPDIDKDAMERHWRRIRTAAGLDDLRLHDLRHSFASILAGDGQSLPIIGALLGHTQAQTTARYVHLLDDPLRKATERAGAKMARRGR